MSTLERGPVNRGAWLASRRPYVAWFVASAGVLAVARWFDPYVFGFVAFGAAGISCALLAIALWHGRRAFAWALLACVPTVLSFATLSTYRWA